MNWIDLTDCNTVEELKKSTEPVVIFKHSTRCVISSMVKDRFERSSGKIAHLNRTYLLDLISHRDVSNCIEDISNVPHESPQVIIFHNGNVVYSASHNSISVDGILESLS